MKAENQALLEQLGFKFEPRLGNNFATIAPEVVVDLSPDHFTADYRTLFLGECKGGFYMTSHIVGKFRKYRARKYNECEYKVRNIFAGGATEDETVAKWIENFKNRVYNIR